MDEEVCDSVAFSDDSGQGRRRRVHGMLKLYYGLNEEGKAEEQPKALDPCDINGPHFDPEHFLNKVRYHCSRITGFHSDAPQYKCSTICYFHCCNVTWSC